MNYAGKKSKNHYIQSKISNQLPIFGGWFFLCRKIEKGLRVWKK